MTNEKAGETGDRALLIRPIVLIAAAACTTGFTFASRRATLRQIQASPADISERLRQMAQKPWTVKCQRAPCSANEARYG
ncbi:MAG: hypothetical protein ACYS7M_12300 [Planctomycetota bacterium]